MNNVPYLKWFDTTIANRKRAAVLDCPASLDMYNITLNGTDNNGDFVRARQVVIDNTANKEQCKIEFGIYSFIVVPYSRRTFNLPEDMSHIQLLVKTGKVKLTFAEFNIGIPDDQLNEGLIVDDELMELYTTPEEFGAVGDGATDDYAALTKALTAPNKVVFLSPGKTYASSQRITFPANVIVNGYGATLLAAQNFGFNNFFTFSGSGQKLFGITFDCANVKAPTTPWLGADYPIGSGGNADGTVIACNDVLMQDITVKNTQSGGMFLRSCKRWKLLRCLFFNVQITTAVVVSGAFEIYNCEDIETTNCEINGYTLKGFNFGNSLRSRNTDCFVHGAGQNVGHAAFFENGSTGSVWTNPKHDGPGYAFKCDTSNGCTLINPTFTGSGGGVYAQIFTDFKLIGGVHYADAASRQGLILEGMGGGGGRNALIDGYSYRRSVPGTLSNHVFCLLSADATSPLVNIDIVNCYSESAFTGIITANAASSLYNNININNNRFLNTNQYGALIYANGVKFNYNIVQTATTTQGVYINQVAGAAYGNNVQVIGNMFSGYTQYAIGLGNGGIGPGVCRFENVEISKNQCIGGVGILRAEWTTNPTDEILNLSIDGNEIHSGTNGANIITLSLNATTFTNLNITNNKLMQLNFAYGNINIVNPGQIANGMEYGNQFGTIVGRGAKMFPYEGVAAPVALTWKVGDRVRRNPPVVGSPIGWNCTVAGTPGTWVAEANL